MLYKILILTIVFIAGEIFFNLTLFRYTKKYFAKIEKDKQNITENKEDVKTFLLFDISIFKGILERFVLFVALVLNMTQILIVFGTLKIGSRFDKNNKILNDYFIIGNFSSLLISIFYSFCYFKLNTYFNN